MGTTCIGSTQVSPRFAGTNWQIEGLVGFVYERS